MPHVVTAWHGSPQTIAAKFAEIVVFLVVGVATGVLSDRERKRSQELQKTTDQLRTAHRELQDSFEHLSRAGRLAAVGQLAASLAHEIRNPLASIEGAVDIIERSRNPERRTEVLAIVKKEILRLKDLLTNLLNFARPRPPEIRRVKINELIESVVELTAHDAEKRGVELSTHVSSPLPAAECDGEQIRQVLLNLTLNALEASDAGGGKVVLSARNQDNNLLIEVADEGRGIAEADLEKIFDPFYTTKEDGTGLGLAISSQILIQHSGTITVKRNPVRGLTFTLVLPLAQNRTR